MASRKSSKKKSNRRSEVVVRPQMGVTDYDPAFADEIGSGHEEVTGDDIATPFLNILHPLSPQCSKKTDKYVEGAEGGMLMHSITGELFPADKDEGHAGVIVIPAHFQSRWIEWIPRKKGGGFIRQYEVGERPDRCRKGDINVLLSEDGERWKGDSDEAPRQAVYTHLHYLLMINDAGFEPIIFSQSSTGLTPGSKWNAEMRAMIPAGAVGPLPRYSTAWHIHTKFRENDQGQWFTWIYNAARRLKPSEDEGDNLLVVAAREFKKAVQEKLIEVDMAQSRAADQTSRDARPSAEPGTAGKGPDGEDLPF